MSRAYTDDTFDLGLADSLRDITDPVARLGHCWALEDQMKDDAFLRPFGLAARRARLAMPEELRLTELRRRIAATQESVREARAATDRYAVEESLDGTDAELIRIEAEAPRLLIGDYVGLVVVRYWLTNRPEFVGRAERLARVDALLRDLPADDRLFLREVFGYAAEEGPPEKPQDDTLRQPAVRPGLPESHP